MPRSLLFALRTTLGSAQSGIIGMVLRGSAGIALIGAAKGLAISARHIRADGATAGCCVFRGASSGAEGG